MKVSEILGVGLWAASAVQVTRYTYQALSGQYEQFPAVDSGGTINGGPGNGNLNPLNPIIGKGLPGVIFGTGPGSIYQWGENARNKVEHAITGPLTPTQKKVGKRISGQPGNGRFGPVG